MPTTTIQVAPAPVATLLVSEGDGPTLVTNTDLVNSIVVGDTEAIKYTDGYGIVTLGPNGSVVVNGENDFFGAPVGNVSVAVATVQGGMSNFLGLTQGGGSLVLPSVHSPGYITGISGWTINKDGSAEFNNLTVRGVFLGLDFILNSNGLFFYNGTPAFGNLKISIVSNGGGTDQFGNVYVDNITCYNIAVAGGGHVTLAANPSTGIPFLVMLPPGAVTLNAPPQVNSGMLNAGLANEQSQINVNSGWETTQGATSAGTLQLVGRPNNGGTSLAKLFGDLGQIALGDGNVYALGSKTISGTTIAITSTGFSTLFTIPLGVGTYRVKVKLVMAANANVGDPSIRYTQTATLSNAGGDGAFKVGAAWAGQFIYNGVANFANVASANIVMTSGQLMSYESDLQVIASVAGNLFVQGASSTAGANWTLSSNSFVDYWLVQ